MVHVTGSFLQASAVSEEILKTEYDSVRLMYTSFKSAISFKPTIATVLSPETLEKSEVIAEKLDQYEIEGPDRAELLHDMGEFQLACMMYYSMNEAATSEHASRMQVRMISFLMAFSCILMCPEAKTNSSHAIAYATLSSLSVSPKINQFISYRTAGNLICCCIHALCCNRRLHVSVLCGSSWPCDNAPEDIAALE